jgi:hypothetical protein
MAEYSINADRSRFFAAIRSAQNSNNLIEEYMRYDGILYPDQISCMQRHVAEAWTREGRACDPAALLAGNGDISPDFLAAEYPELSPMRFGEMDPTDFQVIEILPASPNQYQIPDAPIPPSLRLRFPMRSAFCLLKVTCYDHSLFAFPHGYQLFRRDKLESPYDVRSRSFATSTRAHPPIAVNRAVVVIQDINNGDSFCHFFYDWLPRVIYFIKAAVEPVSNVVFLMGGIPSKFHELLISLLAKNYGIPRDCFMFPENRMILDVYGPIYFFSDQVRDQIHPAHMAHPQTIQILRELIGEATRKKGPHRRLFISRGDAALRRITNEDELIRRLAGQGFTAVRLADHDIETQIALIRGAEIVVGAHGMGFTTILSHDGGLKLMELFHPHIGSDAYIFVAKACGFQHRYIVGDDANDDKGGYAIAPETLEANLSLLMDA